PKHAEIRPTSDMTRESIFNVVRSKLIGANFLDLFAGSGAMGLEALSEGAKLSVFVDKSSLSIATIRKNIKLLGVADESIVVKKDVLQFLEKPYSEIAATKFDLIFIDPPYASKLASQTLAVLTNSDLMSEGAIIIAEHSSIERLEDTYKGIHSFVCFKRKVYGTIVVNYFEYTKDL
ncbi:MAG: 16S rRNA (guanine(966)-N(2))-methyltransferase RsmD, partial [Caldisericaceae bacterium]